MKPEKLKTVLIINIHGKTLKMLSAYYRGVMRVNTALKLSANVKCVPETIHNLGKCRQPRPTPSKEIILCKENYKSDYGQNLKIYVINRQTNNILHIIC